jgi:hypothetical protein
LHILQPRLSDSAVRYLASSLFSCLLLACASAAADTYSIPHGDAATGSVLASGRVSLGIRVNIDKNWDALAEADKQVWREYTEITDPDVTPPFFQPNIRSFLKRLNYHDFTVFSDSMQNQTRLLLVVRVAETGAVERVELMQAGTDGQRSLTVSEKALAGRWITALMGTRFAPAMVKGQAAASAFIMEVHGLTTLR